MNRRMVVALALGWLAACGGHDQSAPAGSATGSSASRATPTGRVDLTGAGATFPYPIYSKWFADYARQTGVEINYQSIGSGGGIRQLTEGTIDFGASDAPMSDAELAQARRPILHFPTVIGAVAITYNLPRLPQPLRLSGDVIAQIYQGQITKWNDSRIVALNPGVTLPPTDILVVHRSDGSGTTYIFSDFLSAVDSAWAESPGRGKELAWPVGLGAKGNEGVAGQIKQTEGAIGYVELAYAKQNHLPTAAVENAAGTFVLPSIESATAAAAGKADHLPPTTDYRISIVNAPGKSAYPIASFTWLLAYKQQSDATKARQLKAFLHWYLRNGERSVAALEYAPLPANMIARLDARVDSIGTGGGR